MRPAAQKRRCDAARRQAEGGVVVNHVQSHFTEPETGRCVEYLKAENHILSA